MGKTKEAIINTENLLNALKKKGKQDRDKLAKNMKTSAQRISGFIDSMEELQFVSVDRTVRPYQVDISELGKKVLALLTKHTLSDISRKGVDNL